MSRQTETLEIFIDGSCDHIIRTYWRIRWSHICKSCVYCWRGNWCDLRCENSIWKGGALQIDDRQCFRVFTVVWTVSSAQVSNLMLCSNSIFFSFLSTVCGKYFFQSTFFLSERKSDLKVVKTQMKNIFFLCLILCKKN